LAAAAAETAAFKIKQLEMLGLLGGDGRLESPTSSPTSSPGSSAPSSPEREKLPPLKAGGAADAETGTTDTAKDAGTDSDGGANDPGDIERSRTPDKADTAQSPAAAKETAKFMFLESLLNRRLKVTLSDERVIFGRLLCTDHDCNLIMSECAEHGPLVTAAFTAESDTGKGKGKGDASASTGADAENENDKELFRRNLGLVMVPGPHIVSLCTQQSSQGGMPMFV